MIPPNEHVSARSDPFGSAVKPIDKGSHLALRTEEIQKQIIASTEEQAAQRITEGTPVSAYVTAYRMSQAAYRVFENRMNQEFSSPEYSDLLALTLMSRETPFLVELKQRLETLFKNTPPQKTEADHQ